MNDSFSQWRGGDKPHSKSTNQQNSLVISDSEDDDWDPSITNNDQRQVIIETSEGDDDTSRDLTDLGVSNDGVDYNNRRSSIPANRSTKNASKSDNDDSRVSDTFEEDNHDDSSSSPDVPPVYRKKRVKNRIITFDDSDTDVEWEIEEPDESLKSNEKSKLHIEFSDSESDANDFEDSRMSNETRDNNDQSAVQSIRSARDLNESDDNGSPVSDGAANHDDSSSSPEIKIYRKNRIKNRTKLDDSETDEERRIEEPDESVKSNDKSKVDIEFDSDSEDPFVNSSRSSRPSISKDESKSRRRSDLATRDEKNLSKSFNNANLKEIAIGLDANTDSERRINSEDSITELISPEKDMIAAELEESCVTISDSSDSDETNSSRETSEYTESPSRLDASGSSTSTFNSEHDAIVMSLVKREVGVGNVDPMIAQRRAILSCNIQQVKSQLAKSKMLLNTANLALLPDKGEKLRRSIDVNEGKLQELNEQWESLPKIETPSPVEKKFEEVEDMNPNPLANHPWKGLPVPKEVKTLGRQALATQEREQALTEDRLKDLHGSLNARPSEDERAEDPKGLKVCLMPHQQHALAWLLWREKQKPHGGILADDMGLGKTLTMISLIMSTMGDQESDENSEDSDDEWHHRKRSSRPKGGTLVVCPASVLSQWEGEINKRVRRGMLSVELFHGTNRESVPRRLAKNDVVITTYNLISREYNKGNSRSVIHEINWKRVILDEAHIVRNPNSQASEAVCKMTARARWALTGTPIQNKELDLYALLKFLKCTPFDDLKVWKRWVDNKNAHGHERLATLMKTLMLRRTKQELQAKGGLGNLPDKNLEEIEIKLDPEEQLVYEKVLVFSRTLFAQFLHQRAEKHHMFQINAGNFDAPTFLQKPKDTQFTKVQNQLLARHADVKAHEILVLLLRLRQVCCHPALIKAMLDQEDLKGNDIVDETGENPDLLSGLGSLKLEDDENIDPNEIGVDRRVVEDLLTTQNPVFDPTRQSSKMRAVLNTIQEILDKGDKMVVVSQWTSMLEVVRTHLESLNGATYDILSGSVPVKKRQHVVESFNKVGSSPQILLLSLTAGGVGLNLVGGNHLLLLDIHWNPQLEAQAQDRIYRVGQTKSVYIYKFMCLDTVEQRIKALQDHKLAIAQGVLTGAGPAGASKLTLDDLKSLFGV